MARRFTQQRAAIHAIHAMHALQRTHCMYGMRDQAASQSMRHTQ